MSLFQEKALVLFSGGQDSTTCLGWTLNRFESVETIGFAYGQRHAVELTCRQKILRSLGNIHAEWSQKLGSDTVLDVNLFNQIGETAMTADLPITQGKEGFPTTFVPGRNLIFLTTAAALAWRKGIRHLVLGVCETDYSGYPDCQDNTIKAMQVALNLGMKSNFVLHTPLMWLDKAHTWQLAFQEGGQNFVELIRTESHSCYLGDRNRLHEWGYGCGTCPACQLRKKGWEMWKNTQN